MLSKELKKICNYRKGGNKGFDTVITRLQMQIYVTIADFVYIKKNRIKGTMIYQNNFRWR